MRPSVGKSEICALIACIATLLIISCFIIHELNPNGTKEQDLTPRTILKNIKSDNANKIIIGHLNINSIRNKFECLKYMIDKNVDLLLISETKLDETFPEQQFHIEGFSPPYRRDRNDKGGGLLLFVREYVPSRKINVELSPQIEAIVIEINLKKKEVDSYWLLQST